MLIAFNVSEDGRTLAAVSAAIWEIENRFRNTTPVPRQYRVRAKLIDDETIASSQTRSIVPGCPCRGLDAMACRVPPWYSSSLAPLCDSIASGFAGDGHDDHDPDAWVVRQAIDSKRRDLRPEHESAQFTFGERQANYSFGPRCSCL
jgi:hypothetical protein